MSCCVVSSVRGFRIGCGLGQSWMAGGGGGGASGYAFHCREWGVVSEDLLCADSLADEEKMKSRPVWYLADGGWEEKL